MGHQEHFSIKDGTEDLYISIRFTAREAADIADWVSEHHYDSQIALHDAVMNQVVR